jgi:hypothetical protein
MDEFLPAMLHSHLDHLSPPGTDLMKEIAFKTYLNLVPMNNFLNGLFDGRRKEIVRLIAWDDRGDVSVWHGRAVAVAWQWNG